MPLILVEDDRVLRMLAMILDPEVPAERLRALSDFMAHDVADFSGWLAATRKQFPGLFPAQMVYVADQNGLRSHIADADAVVVESLAIGEAELAVARRLRLVQKFGTVTRNIDLTACGDHGVPVAFLRRRQNIAVAEHAFALTLALAKRLNELDQVVTADRLSEAGFQPSPFDRRYTSNSNFGRVPGLRTLHGTTAGVIGYGEIGREYAQRAAAFGMTVLYTQRTEIPAGEVAGVQAGFRSLEALLRESDVVSVHLPLTDATRGLIGPKEFGQAKRGMLLVNTARADIIPREALMQALDSGRVAGFGLDTGYDEPTRPDDPLLDRRNVILTPHIAPANRLNGLLDIRDLCANLAAVIGG